MSGDHPLLERKLRKSGKSAMATVVSYDRIKSGPMAYGASRKSLCKLNLRVAPDGESAFEATTEAWLRGTEGAHDGMVVPVLYDPSDHARLIVDQSDEAWKAADGETMRARRVAQASAKGGDPARTSAIDEMRRAAAADPAGFRKLMRDQGPAVFGLPGVPASVPGVAAPTPQDPLDRLSKLAELHDRGVLSDPEFETEKKKILGD